MASTQPQLHLPSLDNTFGAMLIGLILSTALWGAGSMQLYWYYSSYPRDHAFLKTLIASVWIFDTIQQAMIGHILYFYLVANYFNPLGLDYLIWSLNVQVTFEALTSLGVQALFIYRIGRLSRWNMWYMSVTTILALAKFGVAAAYVAESMKLHSVTAARTNLNGLSDAINGVSAASDVLIGAIFTWLLSRSKTSFIRTDTIINKLIGYTINTSLLTSLCSVVTLILSVSMPKNFIYGIFYFLIAKLYVNSLLATLNTRKPHVSTYEEEIDLKANSFSHHLRSGEDTSYDSSAYGVAKPGIRIQVTESAITSTGDSTTFDNARTEEQSYGKVNTEWQEGYRSGRV